MFTVANPSWKAIQLATRNNLNAETITVIDLNMESETTWPKEALIIKYKNHPLIPSETRLQI